MLDRLRAQAARLEALILDERLPDEPDRSQIDQFLVRAYTRARAAG